MQGIIVSIQTLMYMLALLGFPSHVSDVYTVQISHSRSHLKGIDDWKNELAFNHILVRSWVFS